jgi:hypothetical protein
MPEHDAPGPFLPVLARRDRGDRRRSPTPLAPAAPPQEVRMDAGYFFVLLVFLYILHIRR